MFYRMVTVKIYIQKKRKTLAVLWTELLLTNSYWNDRCLCIHPSFLYAFQWNYFQFSISMKSIECVIKSMIVQNWPKEIWNSSIQWACFFYQNIKCFILLCFVSYFNSNNALANGTTHSHCNTLVEFAPHIHMLLLHTQM